VLKCEWEGSADGKAQVTPANAMFCLSTIERHIADVMNIVFEKARMECNLRDIKPSSFLPDERSEVMSRGHPQSRQIQEKELVGRVADSVRPLSLEEMRSLIE
jgi:hypothetical protein